MMRNEDLKFSVPNDWTRINYLNGLYKYASALSIRCGKTEIQLFLMDTSLVTYPPQDSRHLLWRASRYASTWKLPLYQWSTVPGWQVYQTRRSSSGFFLVSGASSHCEFLCVASVEPPMTDSGILEALDALFQSARVASERPFARLTTKNLRVRPVAPPSAGDHWIIADADVRVPSGWVVEDTVLPYTDVETDLNYPFLELARRDFHVQSQSLRLYWMRGNQIDRSGNRRIATNWEGRAKRWQMQTDTLITPTPVQDRDSELFVGTIELPGKLPDKSTTKVLLLHHWFYKSASLVLLGQGAVPDLGSRTMIEDALTNIIRQLRTR